MYNNPIPVVVGLVRLWDGRLVGIRRGIEPNIGALVFPGGYVDEGESLEQALARECLEECGFYSNAEDWTLWTSRITPNNRLLVFGVCQKHIRSLDWKSIQRYRNLEIQGIEAIDMDSRLGFPLHEEIRQLHFLHAA
jgi:8-oxo-dGTP pyrophosphatase MutT (NUDIX family)